MPTLRSFPINPADQIILRTAILFFLLSFSFQSIKAQQKKKVYTTKAVANGAPEIDGKLDDKAWETVEWGGDFTQRMPIDNAPPSQKTLFKILYDDRNLYVAIRALDNHADSIVQRMSRRDGFEGDWVEVNIDSYHDLRSAFSFTASVSGVKGDEAVANNGNNWDGSWDPIWYLKTSVDEQGWSAEYRIPLSQLRFADQENHIWGLQVSRRLFRKEEISNWQYISKNAPGWVHLFGELHGIKGIKPQKQLEIQPYTVTKAETAPEEIGNPFATGRSSDIAFGVDGKIGITSDVTLDFTVNPDFGQVEADPSQVNLSAFEVFFEERRPFFIESRNILDYRITSSVAGGPYTRDNLFYSRRIGRPPQYSPDLNDGEYIDRPNNSSILGALKLTGKTQKGLSFALLESVTGREKAEIDFNGTRRKLPVEPLTNYLVGRLQQDLNKGNTILGGVVTATNRDLSDPKLNFLSRSAYSAGVDFQHNWKDRKYFVSGNALFSKIIGSTEAILQSQTASQRYFQRPFISHVRVDSARTSLTGTGATLKGGKGGKGNIRYESGITYRSPELELNDVGYLRSADQINWWTWVGYQTLKPVGIFRYFNGNFNAWSDWDFGGANTSKSFNFNFNTQFKNYWTVGAGITPNSSSLSNADLRGGPAIRYPSGVNMWAFLNSDNRKKLQLTLEYNNFSGSNKYNQANDFYVSLQYRPINPLVVSLAPGYSQYKNDLQYIATQEWEKSPRYITGSLSQRTVKATLRVDYTIKPNLSLQYYGQPFVSKGTYSKYNRIMQSNAKAYQDRFNVFAGNQLTFNSIDNNFAVDENLDGQNDYTFDNPDFTFAQYRSNLILRWEYIPGSTAFLVWSQNRDGELDIRRVAASNITNDIWSIQPQNIFLLKFTYRFVF